jgi:hypothetical protein
VRGAWGLRVLPFQGMVEMRGGIRFAVVLVTFLAVWGFASGSADAQVRANMDFEGLREGMIVSRLASGSGIAGDTVAGSVSVFGDRAPVGDGSTNAAMVYDAACGGGGPANCTGGEDDKFKPMLGKVLTVAYSNADKNGDGLADKPDTAGDGGVLRFDFTGFGTGTVTVRSLDVLDTERGGWIRLFSRGTLFGTVRFDATSNNGLATVAIGRSGVDRMDVALHDSGVIDNVRLAFSARTRPIEATCRSLRLNVRRLAVARRTLVRAAVRDWRRVAMARVRVVARGAGVRTSRLTNARGLARLIVRPRRVGTVRFAVRGSSLCVKRVAVRRGSTAFIPLRTSP